MVPVALRKINMGTARTLTFTIPGRIGGKGRPRMTRKGHVYTPAKTQSDEAVVRQLACLALRGRPPMDGPLGLHIRIVRIHPKSWSKKRREARWVTGKPDCDNVLKLIADAMNGIVYGDDAQIAQVLVSRMYATNSGECVRVGVTQLEG